jgi:hypothetical protein
MRYFSKTISTSTIELLSKLIIVIRKPTRRAGNNNRDTPGAQGHAPRWRRSRPRAAGSARSFDRRALTAGGRSSGVAAEGVEKEAGGRGPVSLIGLAHAAMTRSISYYLKSIIRPPRFKTASRITASAFTATQLSAISKRAKSFCSSAYTVITARCCGPRPAIAAFTKSRFLSLYGISPSAHQPYFPLRIMLLVQRRVRSDRVVVFAPLLDDDLRLL